jgi:hypothetical protein
LKKRNSKILEFQKIFTSANGGNWLSQGRVRQGQSSNSSSSIVMFVVVLMGVVDRGKHCYFFKKNFLLKKDNKYR